MNKNNRTDSEESVANKTGGKINQVKGDIKEGFGELVNDPNLKREGMQDRAKGRLQEEYGDLKKKETEIERDLDDASSRGRV